MVVCVKKLTWHFCHRHQEQKACSASAHLPAWSATEPSGMHAEFDVEGGQVRRADGSCTEGKAFQ
jgi:hypothetical protein